MREKRLHATNGGALVSFRFSEMLAEQTHHTASGMIDYVLGQMFLHSALF
jgi:hypothetical protein